MFPQAININYITLAAWIKNFYKFYILTNQNVHRQSVKRDIIIHSPFNETNVNFIRILRRATIWCYGLQKIGFSRLDGEIDCAKYLLIVATFTPIS